MWQGAGAFFHPRLVNFGVFYPILLPAFQGDELVSVVESRP